MKQRILITIMLLLVLVGCITVPTQDAIQPTVSTETEYYIPFVYKQTQIIGVESEAPWSTTKQFFNQRTLLKTSCRWGTVEKTKGVYDWTSCDVKLPPDRKADWLTFKTSPEWSISPGTPVCKLPNKDNWKYAAQFIQAMINRYHPQYVEIWNEPDPPVVPVNNETLYGCVGDAKLYAEFYKYIHQHVSGATLVAGAFAGQGDFAIGVLQELDGHADMFSMHCYPYYASVFDELACQKKLDNLSRFTDSRIAISETAVYYYSGSISGFEQAQLTHYRWLKTTGDIFFWYTATYNGWPSCSPDPCNTDIVTRKNGEFVLRPVGKLYIKER